MECIGRGGLLFDFGEPAGPDLRLLAIALNSLPRINAPLRSSHTASCRIAFVACNCQKVAGRRISRSSVVLALGICPTLAPSYRKLSLTVLFAHSHTLSQWLLASPLPVRLANWPRLPSADRPSIPYQHASAGEQLLPLSDGYSRYLPQVRIS